MTSTCPTTRFSGSRTEEEKIPWQAPPGLSIQKIPAGKNIVDMLLTGDLDAVIDPEVIRPIVTRDPRVRRLFPNYRDLEIDYFKRTGIFPIMHTTAIRQEIVDKYPWVPTNLMQAFEESKKISYKRMENPRIVPLAWFRSFVEEQEEIFGGDPWVYGPRRHQPKERRDPDAVFFRARAYRQEVKDGRTLYRHVCMTWRPVGIDEQKLFDQVSMIP